MLPVSSAPMFISSGVAFTETETGLKSEDRLISSFFPPLPEETLNARYMVVFQLALATFFNRPHLKISRARE